MQLREESRFPLVSTLSLVYPIGSMIYLWRQGAPFPVGFGYGLANLGYVLLIAAFLGSFKVLGLTRRVHIFATAIGFWLLGTLAMNAAIWLGDGGHRHRAFFVVVPFTLGILYLTAVISKREKAYIFGVAVLVVANAIASLL